MSDEKIEKDKHEIIVKLFLLLRPNRETTKAICDSMITDVCARKMLNDLLSPGHTSIPGFKKMREVKFKKPEPEEGEEWKQQE